MRKTQVMNSAKQRTVTTTASAALLVSAIVGPLLAGPQVAGNHLFLFRLLSLILLPVLAVSHMSRNQGRIIISRGEILLCLFLLYSTFLLVSTSSITNGLSSSSVVLLPIASGIVIGVNIQDRDDLATLSVVLVLLLCLSVIIAISEMSFGYHLPTSRIPTLPENQSQFASAWYYNRNDLGTFLSIVFPFVFIQMIYKTGFERAFSILLAGTISGITYLNGSRGAQLGIIAASFVCGIMFMFRKSLTNVRSEVYTLLSVIPLFFISVVVIIVVTPPDVSIISDYSILVRWRLLNVAVDSAINTIVGAGLGDFQNVVQQSSINTFGILTPHGWLTWLLAVTGIPGTLIFLMILVSILKANFNTYINSEEPLCLATIGVIISFSISGMSPSNVLHFEGIWIILAILTTVGRVTE